MTNTFLLIAAEELLSKFDENCCDAVGVINSHVIDCSIDRSINVIDEQYDRQEQNQNKNFKQNTKADKVCTNKSPNTKKSTQDEKANWTHKKYKHKTR